VDAATVLAPNTGIRTPRAAVSQHSNDAHLANFAAHVVVRRQHCVLQCILVGAIYIRATSNVHGDTGQRLEFCDQRSIEGQRTGSPIATNCISPGVAADISLLSI